ncbi:hypothetical protein ILYODFUR_010380 [Ilyodon furcidens]|uniref:Secreted protein n=1 Tax=Ilyodon furcidens TaxID=33524 RepID=A0ABV0TX90_9TELE
MSPWVTILKVLFMALHFPQPALPPAAFLCFCVRPRKLPCLRQNPHFIILSPGAGPSKKKNTGVPLPAELQWTAYSFTELDSSTFRLFSIQSATLLIMHLRQIKPTQGGFNGAVQRSQGC